MSDELPEWEMENVGDLLSSVDSVSAGGGLSYNGEKWECPKCGWDTHGDPIAIDVEGKEKYRPCMSCLYDLLKGLRIPDMEQE